MSELLSTFLEILGGLLVIGALGLMWLPLGVLAAGCALVAAGYLLGDGS